MNKWWGMLVLMSSLVNLQSGMAEDSLIKFSGDLRYRHDRSHVENAAIRTRHLLRARAGFLASVSEGLDVEMRLNTQTVTPTLANSSLDDAFAAKEVRLDLASFRYTSLEFMEIGGGKVRNPFITPGKSQLIWDADVNPEGLYTAFHHDGDNWGIKAKLAGIWIEERENADDMLYAAQVAPEFKWGDTKLMIGGSYYQFDKTKGSTPYVTPTNSQGNSMTGWNTYAYQYRLMEGFAQLDFKISSLPLAVFFDYVSNDDPKTDNVGWLGGFSVGQIKKGGDWKVSYDYRELEKNATIGAFTDSDFKGGGTNTKGHKISAEYALVDRASLALNQYYTKTAIYNGLSFSRTQLDFNLQF